MMNLTDGHTYLLPDGRRLRAHREWFAGMAEPAWTLVPAHLLPPARPPLAFLTRCIHVERGELYRFELRDREGAPKPVVQHTGWTTGDLIDFGAVTVGDREVVRDPFFAR